MLARERVPRSNRPRVLGVDHVAVAVADLDRSLEFYAGLLGLRVRDRGPVDPDLVERMTGLPGAEVEFADVELGGRTLELLSTARRSREGWLRRARSGRALSTSPSRWRTRTGARPARPGPASRRCSAPQLLEDDGSDWAGCQVFYVRDPDGALLEIVQRPAVARRVVTPAAVSYRP